MFFIRNLALLSEYQMARLVQDCQTFAMSMQEANLRWVCNHSHLNENDVVEGATLVGGPLPLSLAVTWNELHANCKPRSPKYFASV